MGIIKRIYKMVLSAFEKQRCGEISYPKEISFKIIFRKQNSFVNITSIEKRINIAIRLFKL